MIITKEQTDALIADLKAQDEERRVRSAAVIQKLIAGTAAITTPKPSKGGAR